MAIQPPITEAVIAGYSYRRERVRQRSWKGMDMSKDESQGDRRWLGTAGSVRLAVGAASILVIVMEIAGVDLPLAWSGGDYLPPWPYTRNVPSGAVGASKTVTRGC